MLQRECIRRCSYLCSLRSSGLLAGLVLDHLHPQHQPLPSDIPDDAVLLLQGPYPLQQKVTHLQNAGKPQSAHIQGHPVGH